MLCKGLRRASILASSSSTTGTTVLLRGCSVSRCRADALRILFCGADDFSIASLRALEGLARDVPGLIESIDVVHRPAKRTGRGMRILREVPIKHFATQHLGLDTHVIDTFTGWTPPVAVNLIVAVSFGLFVPPRILGLAKYGGLNVHPSLLPDLRGSAPIQHAILKGRKYTGVSVQTLHHEHFDHGTILAQTPAPGIKIPENTRAAGLENQLATAGAEMLVDVIKTGAFIPPVKDNGWYSASSGPVDHAPKIAKQDRFISFDKHSMTDIMRVQHALGDPWCILPNGDRLILHSVTRVLDTEELENVPQSGGLWTDKSHSLPLFRAACGAVGVIDECTYAGSKAGAGNAKLMRMLKKEKEKES